MMLKIDFRAMVHQYIDFLLWKWYSYMGLAVKRFTGIPVKIQFLFIFVLERRKTYAEKNSCLYGMCGALHNAVSWMWRRRKEFFNFIRHLPIIIFSGRRDTF
jgi:hypothetical protein